MVEHQPSKLIVRVRFPSPAPIGGIPERPKGADCKSAVADFDGSNPSPTTISDFRRPMDGFFIAFKRKSAFFKSRTYTNKMVVGFSWYTFGTQMIHKILCRQRCKKWERITKRNVLFPDESSGSFRETAGIFEIRHVLNTYI